MATFRIKYKNPSTGSLVLVRNVRLKANTPEEARSELQAGAGGGGKHNYLLNDIRNVIQIEKTDIDDYRSSEGGFFIIFKEQIDEVVRETGVSEDTASQAISDAKGNVQEAITNLKAKKK